jgi:site-specific DNA-methyltransferase (adenine-specific)
MGYSYRGRHECIVYLEKGKRRLNDLSVADVLSAPRVRGEYPTEKPVEVLKTLVRQSSVEGDLVIDPFLGSGSTGEAALSLGRRFAGCDVTQRSVDLAAQRLYQQFSIEPGRVVTPRRPPAQGSLFT